MGEAAHIDSQTELRIQADFPYAHEIFLIHDGKKILASKENKLAYKPEKPGFYRVEVYLKERSPLQKDIPWILSNPIFFREKGQ